MRWGEYFNLSDSTVLKAKWEIAPWPDMQQILSEWQPVWVTPKTTVTVLFEDPAPFWDEEASAR